MNAKMIAELSEGGLLSHCVASRGASGRWTVSVVSRLDSVEVAMVTTTRGNVREFATLEAVVRFLARATGEPGTVLRVPVGELPAVEVETCSVGAPAGVAL